MAVTRYPVAVKLPRVLSMLVPVLSKKFRKTGICIRNTSPVISSTSSESMALSVTTVPSAFGNETPSHLFSTAHLANSPERGMTRLRAYERNLNTWAEMPKGNDSSIQVQLILWSSTSSTCLKSNPRYIQ